MNSTDKIFYIIGLVILGGLIAVSLLQLADFSVLTAAPFPCSFHLATGLYCPGCGGTHAVYALLSGNILQSIRLNAFVPYTALCFLLFILWNTAATLARSANGRPGESKNSLQTKRRTSLPFFHFRPVYAYIGIGILLSQWILKNICILFF